MADKTARWVFLLGITLSFPIMLVVMLGIMGVFSDSRAPARRSFRPARTAPAGQAPAASESSQRSVTQTPPAVGSAESRARAVPLVDVPEPVAEPTPERVRLDAGTARELARLKQGYNQRIDQLQEHRDIEIALLARGLAKLSPAAAAEVVQGLDDELLARALEQMKPASRRALLGAFPPQRVQRIQQWLRKLARD